MISEDFFKLRNKNILQAPGTISFRYFRANIRLWQLRLTLYLAKCRLNISNKQFIFISYDITAHWLQPNASSESKVWTFFNPRHGVSMFPELTITSGLTPLPSHPLEQIDFCGSIDFICFQNLFLDACSSNPTYSMLWCIF